mgnify:FL=1
MTFSPRLVIRRDVACLIESLMSYSRRLHEISVAMKVVVIVQILAASILYAAVECSRAKKLPLQLGKSIIHQIFITQIVSVFLSLSIH